MTSTWICSHRNCAVGRHVPDADFFYQRQAEAVDDAVLELRNDVVGLHRDAAIHDTPEIVALISPVARSTETSATPQTNPADFLNRRSVFACRTWCFPSRFWAGCHLSTAAGYCRRLERPSRAGRRREQRPASERSAIPKMIRARIPPSHMVCVTAADFRGADKQEW
jgi:hypothetical protein